MAQESQLHRVLRSLLRPHWRVTTLTKSTRECSAYGRPGTDETTTTPTRARSNCRRLSVASVKLKKATASLFGMLHAFSGSKKTSSAVFPRSQDDTAAAVERVEPKSSSRENRVTVQCRVPSSAQPQQYWPSLLLSSQDRKPLA